MATDTLNRAPNDARTGDRRVAARILYQAMRLAGLLTLVVAWQAVAGLVRDVPSPTEVVQFVTSLSVGMIITTIATSLGRLGLGLAFALPLGWVLGIAIGRSVFVDRLSGYVSIGMLAMPAAIWALLAIMWFGFRSEGPIVATILTAVPFVTFNVAAGVRAIPRQLLAMSTSFRVPWPRRMRHVVLPAIGGAMFASVRFAVINGWNAVVLTEWFGSNVGVGGQARFWYDANRMEAVTGWILLFVLTLVILDAASVQPMYHRVFRWRSE